MEASYNTQISSPRTHAAIKPNPDQSQGLTPLSPYELSIPKSSPKQHQSPRRRLIFLRLTEDRCGAVLRVSWES